MTIAELSSEHLAGSSPARDPNPPIAVNATGRRDYACFMLTVLPVTFLLLFSAYAHLSNNYQFFQSILSYRIVPDYAAVYLAVTLPCLHLCLGLSLLTYRSMRKDAFLLATFLFMIYALAQSISLVRGLDISCGCFGNSEQSVIDGRSIATAFVAMMLSAFGFHTSYGGPKSPRVA